MYYGFSNAVMTFGRATIHNFDTEYYPNMMRGLQQPGVNYVGMVDHVTLAEGFARAGFVLYPTVFPETGEWLGPI